MGKNGNTKLLPKTLYTTTLYIIMRGLSEMMTKEEFEQQWNLKYPEEHLLMLRIGEEEPFIELYVTGYRFFVDHDIISVYYNSACIGSVPLSLIREVV